MAAEACQEYLAYVCHEIRNPASAISGAASLLSRDCHDPEISGQVAIIDLAARYLLDLVRKLLNASGLVPAPSAADKRPVCLKTMFNELEKVFGGSCDARGLSLRVHVGASVPPWLWLDELRVREVLFNLLDNAVKFTTCGGIQLLAKATSIEGQPKLMTLVLTVRDSGIGIPADQHDVVFEPFNQHRLSHGDRPGDNTGTGLGLSICKRIVSAMDGHIDVQSEVDCGSSFKVVLERVQVVHPPDKADDHNE